MMIRERFSRTPYQGCIWSGVLFVLRARLAKGVEHDVEYGEEGVHIDHERRFLSLRERYR
jgi:hypothetical protein